MFFYYLFSGKDIVIALIHKGIIDFCWRMLLLAADASKYIRDARKITSKHITYHRTFYSFANQPVSSLSISLTLHSAPKMEK